MKLLLTSAGIRNPTIKAALVEEYGPKVLAVPEGGGFDVAAWLVPGCCP